MKNLLIILGFILTANAFAQKKKVIIKEIDNYMYKTISNATYETDIDSLKTVLKQYFQQDGFTKTGESNTDMTFYAKVPFICLIRARRLANSANYRRYITCYRTNYKHYASCYQDAYVTVSIYEEKSKKNISISTYIDNYTANASTYARTVFGRYKFDKLSLRKYLYVIYYGKFVPFPEHLANSINDYNAFQDKERGKITRSRNYYLYEQQ